LFAGVAWLVAAQGCKTAEEVCPRYAAPLRQDVAYSLLFEDVGIGDGWGSAGFRAEPTGTTCWNVGESFRRSWPESRGRCDEYLTLRAADASAAATWLADRLPIFDGTEPRSDECRGTVLIRVLTTGGTDDRARLLEAALDAVREVLDDQGASDDVVVQARLARPRGDDWVPLEISVGFASEGDLIEGVALAPALTPEQLATARRLDIGLMIFANTDTFVKYEGHVAGEPVNPPPAVDDWNFELWERNERELHALFRTLCLDALRARAGVPDPRCVIDVHEEQSREP